MKILTKSLLYIFLISLFVGCNHGVYVQKDEEGTSKFTLFKDQFKYEENVGYGKLKVWGPYTIKDSIIIFEYDGENKIPYNYNKNNIEKTHKNKNEEYISVRVVDEVNEDPLLFSNIAFYDESDVLLGGIETNFNGVAKIMKDEKLRFFEISYMGYGTQKFEYKGDLDYDLIIRMERFQAGARSLSGSCLEVFQETILKYEVDDTNNIMKLTRGDVIFEKISKKSLPQ